MDSVPSELSVPKWASSESDQKHSRTLWPRSLLQIPNLFAGCEQIRSLGALGMTVILSGA